MRRAAPFVLVLGVLLMLGVLLGLWLAGSVSTAPSAGGAPPVLPSLAPGPVGPTAESPSAPGDAAPPRRLRLPVRPVVPAALGTEASPAPLLDRRERPPADAAEERQAIQDLLADVDADAAACLAAWSAVDPDAGGTLLLGFNLGPDGLTDAWLEDPDAVPGETLTCLTAAVERHGWANLVSAPAEVTRRLEVPAAR